MRNFIYAVAAAMTAAVSASAQETAPVAPGVPLSTVVASFEARGFAIREIERDGDVWEIEVRGADGVRMEIDVDVASGNVLRERVEK